MQVEISEDGFLNMIIKNGLVEELDRELMKGVGAVLDLNGTSEINLKIKMKRIKNFETAIDITTDVTAKHPQEPRPHKAMFVTAGNGLADQVQTQLSLGLGEEVQPSKRQLSEAKTSSKVTQISGD